MRTIELVQNVTFNERNAHAESLHSNEEGRALRFALLPEQEIATHEAPSSPVHLVILRGRGLFTGADGVERECSQGMMVVFDSGEKHSVRALDEKLVYVAIYKESTSALKYQSPHREMIEARPQHHEHGAQEAGARVPQGEEQGKRPSGKE